MKVGKLRQLIKELLPAARESYTFENAIQLEFPRLLAGYHDQDELVRDILEATSASLRSVNMYGVLYSMQYNDQTMEDPMLLLNLTSVLRQIKCEFPDIVTVANTAGAKKIYEQLKKNTIQ